MKKTAALFMILMVNAGVVLSQGSSTDSCLNRLYIQGDGVNVRAEADTKSSVIMKLNKTDYCTVIEKGKGETIGGKNDFWYKIKNGVKTGWVFGAFTSLKLEGRKTMVMTFKSCDFGDVEHKIFMDAKGKAWDFYGTANNFCKYELCVAGKDTASVGSKEFIDKKFEIIINTIFIKSCINWPDCSQSGIDTEPVIISLQQEK